MKKIIFFTILIQFLGYPVLSAEWLTKRLSATPGDSDKAAIAVYSSNIHVVWAEDAVPTGNYEIFYKKSHDNGSTWGAEKCLSWNSGPSTNPVIAASGMSLHVFWQDATPGVYQIFYKRSIDNGDTWSNILRMSYTPGGSLYPAAAVWGESIHVVWSNYTQNGLNFEIWYKKSADNGDTWTSAKRITYNSGKSSTPSIAIYESNIHIAWQDDNPGNYEVFYKKSEDGGINWTTSHRLSFTPGLSQAPSIAVSNNNIHIVFKDASTGYYNIHYRRSLDNGESWLGKSLTSESLYGCKAPSIAASGPILGLVYFKYEGATDQRLDIWYQRSIDNGNSWNEEQQITFSPGESWRPRISISGKYYSTVHVVWDDSSVGNYEVFYKTKTYVP
ncbi:MAG: exo-alpha-sialidase [Spirochaetes bacterium]|nr:exo-alpha-sialidase [Spirochaetota bacterium]